MEIDAGTVRIVRTGTHLLESERSRMQNKVRS